VGQAGVQFTRAKGLVAIDFDADLGEKNDNKQFVRRGPECRGDVEKALREANFSLRRSLRNLGAIMRQIDGWRPRVRDDTARILRDEGSATEPAMVLKCALAAEVLRSFGCLRFVATGWSMLPMVWPGDVLLVDRVSPDQLQPGDVALVGRGGRLCAHRVASTPKHSESRYWITQGDAMAVPDDPVTESDLLGRVSHLIRGGRRLVVSAKLNVGERLIAGIVRRSTSATRALVYLRGIVRTSGSVVACQG
jgi:signal peptidase I